MKKKKKKNPQTTNSSILEYIPCFQAHSITMHDDFCTNHFYFFTTDDIFWKSLCRTLKTNIYNFTCRGSIFLTNRKYSTAPRFQLLWGQKASHPVLTSFPFQTVNQPHWRWTTTVFRFHSRSSISQLQGQFTYGAEITRCSNLRYF